MRCKRLAALACALAMLHPLAAAAEGEKTVTPPCLATISFLTTGIVGIHFTRDFSYSTFDIYRSTPEGELLYYTYRSELIGDTVMQCALKEGDYRLVLGMPSAQTVDYQTTEYRFTIDDPDMDPEGSYDMTQMEIYLSVNDTQEVDSAMFTEPETADRIVKTAAYYAIARPHFSLGDLDHDGNTDASDASSILVAAALSGLDQNPLSAMQSLEADINGDGGFDSSDASLLLSYAALAGLDQVSGDIYDFAGRTAAE